jgi:ABC-type lipoprotein export system ATPase subunit
MAQGTASKLSATDTETQPILRASGLRRSFKMGDQVLTILKDVDLAVRSGEFLAIEGRSGSGKSTLLHIMGALDTADAGSLKFDGRDYTRHAETGPAKWARTIGSRWVLLVVLVALVVFGSAWLVHRVAMPDADTLEMLRDNLILGEDRKEVEASLARATRAGKIWWASLSVLVLVGIPYIVASITKLVHYLLQDRSAAAVRNRDFGFVFQFYHLLPELNVLENTMLSSMIQFSWAGFFGRRQQLRERATAVLSQLGMSHRLKHRPAQLSGGERQRVAIARALMNNPRVLFADEPTGNLDVETGLQIMGVLERLHQEQGQTIVMVTHDRTLARRADRVLVMKDGKLERADG